MVWRCGSQKRAHSIHWLTYHNCILTTHTQRRRDSFIRRQISELQLCYVYVYVYTIQWYGDICSRLTTVYTYWIGSITPFTALRINICNNWLMRISFLRLSGIRLPSSPMPYSLGCEGTCLPHSFDNDENGSHKKKTIKRIINKNFVGVAIEDLHHGLVRVDGKCMFGTRQAYKI